MTGYRGLLIPSSAALFYLERRLSVFFFNDTATTESDRKAFEGYRRGRFIAVGDLLSGPQAFYSTLEEALSEVLFDQ